jgi:hypothetical protein
MFKEATNTIDVFHPSINVENDHGPANFARYRKFSSFGKPFVVDTI